jgi:hypothetical protein
VVVAVSVCQVGSLFLIDLAGSETVHENTNVKSTAEGKAIVKSLFHLRNCGE